MFGGHQSCAPFGPVLPFCDDGIIAEPRDATIERVMYLERRLLHPSARTSPEELDALLHPEFREVGASGRVWDRDSVIKMLTQEVDSSEPIQDEEMLGSVLAEGVVLLSYVAIAAERRARRTSVWRRDDAGAAWRLFYHQRTFAE
jgi:hypothetical protein